MSASNEQDSSPSSFSPGQDSTSTAVPISVSIAAGAPSTPAPAPTSSAAVKAAMQARRMSRGQGEGLRPDFVFPKPQHVQTPLSPHAVNGHNRLQIESDVPFKGPSSTVFTLCSPDSANHDSSINIGSVIGNTDGQNKRLSVPLANGSLAPPIAQQQHLKTHYRTHSRNGSTVTVQDLKQAIAAVSTDLLDLPPLTAVSSNSANTDTSAISTADTTARSESSTGVTSNEATSMATVPEEHRGEKSPRQGLVLQLNSLKVDTANAPLTPLRESCASPLLSPSVSTRSNSMLNRSTRDRSNVAVPPFFAYSIPHELPSPYTSPRLLLPGAAGPTSLPASPFARKRKHAYRHTPVLYPSSTITVKLPGQVQSAVYDHRLPVGNVDDIQLYEHDQDSVSEMTKESAVEDTTASGTRTSVVDKRISWASMITMDEDQASKTPPVVATPAASQPYRPPNRRDTVDVKTSSGATPTNGHRKSIGADSPRPQRRPSPTQDKENAGVSPASEPSDSKIISPVRARKAVPPPLNLTGNNNTEDNSKPAAGSPTTPTTPSRRRRSRSRKNNVDKSLDGTQAEDVDKDETDQAESASQGDKQQQQEGTADKSKKTRTRSHSRSRSRSRNRAHADNSSSQGSSNESVPPVPQTPSWVPTHNMTFASAGPPSATGTTPVSLSAPAPVVVPASPGAFSHSNPADPPVDPVAPSVSSAPRSPLGSSGTESDLKRRGPRPARLLSTRSTNNLQTLSESGPAMFSPRSARDGPSDYFSMRPLQHPPRTPMTPGGDYGDDEDDYYGRLQMVTTPMIQNGFFPNWAKGDAQLEELERIRQFLAARQYPDEMPLSDEWTLFFSDTSRAKDKSGVQDAYSSAITPLFSCHTVPQFATSWKYVRERVRPATMKVNQNLHWFKKGIKPMWEDPKNKYGGRLTLCPPRALLDIVWETVLILMAGDVLDHHGEGTGAVFARRTRGDRVEVWLGADDTPEALAHIRGVLCQELAASGADELVKTAKYKKHFDGRREEKLKQQQLAKEAAGTSGASTASAPSTPSISSSGANGFHGLSSPLLPMTPKLSGASGSSSGSHLSEFQSFEAFTQHQQQQQLLRERERERERESLKGQERIMQLGKERLEKERAEKDRLRDEKVRAMAAAAMAASEAKHQQQLREQQKLQQQKQQL
ncbi:hypothetical protein BGZ54_001416 [Gamsiella multidivaricata]|nr:hypothetical protein BGZ54_001416 [Gamsiella multidivaricata]